MYSFLPLFFRGCCSRCFLGDGFSLLFSPSVIHSLVMWCVNIKGWISTTSLSFLPQRKPWFKDGTFFFLPGTLWVGHGWNSVTAPSRRKVIVKAEWTSFSLSTGRERSGPGQDPFSLPHQIKTISLFSFFFPPLIRLLEIEEMEYCNRILFFLLCNMLVNRVV